MKTLQRVALVLVVLFLIASPALAQSPANSMTLSGAAVGAGLGAAIAILGAGYGFGKIGAAALESMARQPEVAGKIQTGMLLIAALLEGATFFALAVCYLVSQQVKF